jgi:Glu-tRNA(Gln) amidotransferase subunit E-like FAD-binding protein
MSRLELIKLIGDVITELDILRGSLNPNDIRRHDLDEIRKRLDSRQLQLAKNQFNDNTMVFQEVTSSLIGINAEIKGTLNDLNAFVDTIDNLRRFISAIDEVMQAVLPLVA